MTSTWQQACEATRDKIIAFIDRRIGDSNRGALGWLPEAILTLELPPDPTPRKEAEPVGWAVLSRFGDLGRIHSSRSGAEGLKLADQTVVALYPADTAPAVKPALPEPSEEWMNKTEVAIKEMRERGTTSRTISKFVISEYRKLCETAAGGGQAKIRGGVGASDPVGKAEATPPAASLSREEFEKASGPCQVHESDRFVIEQLAREIAQLRWLLDAEQGAHKCTIEELNALTGAKR